jgi:exodeoxyribonuclease VII large subunit
MSIPASPRSPAPQPPDQVLSVAQLNRLARQLLEDCFPMIWVEGEISNLSRPSSGHWYFTLKDEQAQVRCAMFRNRNFRLRLQPADGTRVLVRGKLSLYENRGDYQLIAEDMQPAGAGLLALRFEQLKQKLQAEGLFDAARKRPLPALAQHIAVVTSATGAAIRDILSVLKRRCPAIRVTLIPVPVQGEQAPAAIAHAIALANRLAAAGRADFDVILAGRGGGSLEDLWAFNDERVARAIAASRLPVVSAVGHEVDTTIADFVADVRAPTPSAAAELLSPDWRDRLQLVHSLRARLDRRWLGALQQYRRQLDWARRRLQLQHPGQRLQQWHQRLDELELRLRQAARRAVADRQLRLQWLQTRLHRHHPDRQLQPLRARLLFCQSQLALQMRQLLRQRRQQLGAGAQLLHSVSPLATLQRGYAIVSDSRGQVLRDAAAAQPGDRVQARLAQGQLLCTVDGIVAEPS